MIIDHASALVAKGSLLLRMIAKSMMIVNFFADCEADRRYQHGFGQKIAANMRQPFVTTKTVSGNGASAAAICSHVGPPSVTSGFGSSVFLSPTILASC